MSLKLRWTLGAAAVAGALASSGPQAAVQRPQLEPGRLAGRTQISYGCPGPVRAGESCERWVTFPHARFSVTRIGAVHRAPLLARSDADGRFSLVLAPGSYRVVPLPQPHTRGGAVLTVTVRARATAWKLVRFRGFPQML